MLDNFSSNKFQVNASWTKGCTSCWGWEFIFARTLRRGKFGCVCRPSSTWTSLMSLLFFPYVRKAKHSLFTYPIARLIHGSFTTFSLVNEEWRRNPEGSIGECWNEDRFLFKQVAVNYTLELIYKIGLSPKPSCHARNKTPQDEKIIRGVW